MFRSPRLRTRVAVSFAALALAISSVLAISFYQFSRNYLMRARESVAMTRALLDAQALNYAITTKSTESDKAVTQLPQVGLRVSQQLYQVDGAWVGRTSPVPPEALPQALFEAAVNGGARQRINYDGTPYLAVAVDLTNGMYVEIFSFSELDGELKRDGYLILAIIIIATILGAVLGSYFVGYLLRPVRDLIAGARRLAGGELGSRVPQTGDPDLDPLAATFNNVADALESRLAREQRFSANVSHELRSPVTSVLGTAELLESRSAELPQREAGLVTVLAQQVRHMSHVLLDLLEISRINPQQPTQWEHVNITDLCRDSAEVRNIDVSLIQGQDALVRTDARRVERIVGNLLDNAQTHGHGVVSVHVETEGRQVRVIVDDSGPGVPVDLRERIFEPFHRGDSPGTPEGAGLGLAIAQEQALNIGASITVTDAPDGGARFIVEFPIDEQAS